MTYLNVN